MDNPNHTEYTTDRPRNPRSQARKVEMKEGAELRTCTGQLYVFSNCMVDNGGSLVGPRWRIWWERIKPSVQFWRDMAVGSVVIGGVMWIIW